MMTSTVHGDAAVAAAMSMSIPRVLRAFAMEAKCELLRMLRDPGFGIPFLVLPVPIYLLFGVVIAAPAVAENPGLADYLFSGFSVMAVASPALFGIGVGLAVERKSGLLKIKRAWPAPGGSYLVAKMVMAVVVAGLAMATMCVAAFFAGTLTITGTQVATIAAVMTVGALPFCAIGLFVGAYASASAAPAVANLIFLPMIWLSGLFIPLPSFLEPWAIIWPAFHLNQVAIGAAGLNEFSFVPPQLSVAVLLGVTVLLGGLAIRRLARVG